MTYRIGIDVGGTNTDAVILDEQLTPIAHVKIPTTVDVSVGINQALQAVLAKTDLCPSEIGYAMLGTTHATNAIVERKRLNQVGIIRIGLPATAAIVPLTGWPEDLVAAIGDMHVLVHGGHEFDGREIAPLDEQAVRQFATSIAGHATSVAIISVFSPVVADHEKRASEIVREVLGDIPISLSHEIGAIGLLERENATILNAALVDVARATADGFIAALEREEISAQVYLGQNDGTLMSAHYAKRYPILTIACGPTNSIRGASYLAQLQEAIVVDVGGTTSDVGVLVKGFPRESALAVEIGGVRTNFRMPDLVAIGLGGGSIVRRHDDGTVTVGPDSVGYQITSQALVFGGETLTATDVVVARGQANIGNPELVAHLDQELLAAAWQQMGELIAGAIDQMKTSAHDVPVILVGGGSVIVPPQIPGVCEIAVPEHFGVANAIGSAIAQVSGQVERIFSLEQLSRDEALAQAKQGAVAEALAAGADPDTVQIVDVQDVPLAYLPGNATRIRVKAAGDLMLVGKDS